jgi:hypothetical protein
MRQHIWSLISTNFQEDSEEYQQCNNSSMKSKNRVFSQGVRHIDSRTQCPKCQSPVTCKGNPLTPDASAVSSATTPYASATLTPAAHRGAPTAYPRHITAHYCCPPPFPSLSIFIIAIPF